MQKVNGFTQSFTNTHGWRRSLWHIRNKRFRQISVKGWPRLCPAGLAGWQPHPKIKPGWVEPKQNSYGNRYHGRSAQSLVQACPRVRHCRQCSGRRVSNPSHTSFWFNPRRLNGKQHLLVQASLECLELKEEVQCHSVELFPPQTSNICSYSRDWHFLEARGGSTRFTYKNLKVVSFLVIN